ncbi:hypothetical protein CVIRNUC_003752 [Coccomyxa viridis]|uniref:Uncharacterized protein n=1 Tax=Coccomyxa viridis TaxID=1274662 RepID=A0AAV1I1G9_9CHLO|nr:hypothetical protein CVIRNUC_003752 [Coccomyxa viridis]
MAEDNMEYDLLEDVGEELDYEDFTLEDEDLDDLPPADNEVVSAEDPVTGGGSSREAAQVPEGAPAPAAVQSLESSRPAAATVTPPAQKDATQKDGLQPQPSKKDMKSQQKKATPPQKAGMKKPQPQGQRLAAGRGRGRDNPRGRAGPGRGGRSAERPGDRSGRGRENGSQHFPPSRHGTPPLSGGMQMPGAGMAGLPMPPAMMMPGPRQGPVRPMGGPACMPRPSMQPGMPHPPHAPPPRPMHQGMDRGQQPPPPQSQRPREPIRWPPAMDKQHGQRMDGLHQRQLDAHMVALRQPHMERQPEARMMQNSGPALPFPPGMGDLMKQRLCMSPGAGMHAPSQPRMQLNGKPPSKEGLQMALGMDAVPVMRQRLPPGQLNPSLQDRLNAPLGALNAARRPNGMGGLAPAQAALMRAGESAEELRMKEERQEQERAAQRKKETEAKRKAEELKAKKAEMARLRIQLQQAENRNIALQRAAAEREQQRRESEDFEAMKLRVLQLERLVADKAVADPAAAQEASAALPAAKAAAAKAAAAVAPSVAPAPAPAQAHDASLQVDFEPEEHEEAPPQPKQSRPAQPLPKTGQPLSSTQWRPKAKLEELREAREPLERVSEAAKVPLSIKERLSGRPGKADEQRRQHSEEQAETRAVADLRELLSKKKRLRESDTDEGRLRPSMKSRISRK